MIVALVRFIYEIFSAKLQQYEENQTRLEQREKLYGEMMEMLQDYERRQRLGNLRDITEPTGSSQSVHTLNASSNKITTTAEVHSHDDNNDSAASQLD